MTSKASGSCLIYLFADRFLPRESLFEHVFGHIAVPTPGTDVDVTLGDLELHLLAVALWDLREAGSLSIVEDTSADRGRFSVNVEQPGDWTGLEGHLLELVPDGGTSLWDLMTDGWLEQGDGSLPLNAVVLDAQLEAADLGVTGQPATPNLVPGYFGHHTFPKVEADDVRLQQLRPAFDDLLERWTSAQKEDDLVHALLRACNKVLCDARPGVGLGSASPSV